MRYYISESKGLIELKKPVEGVYFYSSKAFEEVGKKSDVSLNKKVLKCVDVYPSIEEELIAYKDKRYSVLVSGDNVIAGFELFLGSSGYVKAKVISNEFIQKIRPNANVLSRKVLHGLLKFEDKNSNVFYMHYNTFRKLDIDRIENLQWDGELNPVAVDVMNNLENYFVKTKKGTYIRKKNLLRHEPIEIDKVIGESFEFRTVPIIFPIDKTDKIDKCFVIKERYLPVLGKSILNPLVFQNLKYVSDLMKFHSDVFNYDIDQIVKIKDRYTFINLIKAIEFIAQGKIDKRELFLALYDYIGNLNDLIDKTYNRQAEKVENTEKITEKTTESPTPELLQLNGVTVLDIRDVNRKVLEEITEYQLDEEKLLIELAKAENKKPRMEV